MAVPRVSQFFGSANLPAPANAPAPIVSSNASPGSFAGVSTTLIHSHNMGVVKAGEVHLVTFSFSGSKGGTSGATRYVVFFNAGNTATAVMFNNASLATYHDANAVTLGNLEEFTISVLVRVTADGTLAVDLGGDSDGSTTSYGTDDVQAASVRLR